MTLYEAAEKVAKSFNASIKRGEFGEDSEAARDRLAGMVETLAIIHGVTYSRAFAAVEPFMTTQSREFLGFAI